MRGTRVDRPEALPADLITVGTRTRWSYQDR
jgi:hypothetical protein